MTARQAIAKALHDQMCRAAMNGEDCGPERHSGGGYSTAARDLIAGLDAAGYQIRKTP